MWGYEGLAGTAVIGLGAFRVIYGHPYEGDYVVDANWQLGFTAATLAGKCLHGHQCAILRDTSANSFTKDW